MDRFQVLFEIYRKNVEEFAEYQKESFIFFEQYLESFIDFFSLTPDNLLLFSWDEEKSLTQKLATAIQLKPDSFWHVRMGIKLKVKEVNLPEQNLIFEMLFKKYKGNFIMKLGNDPGIDIPYANGKWHHHEFLKYVYEFLVDFYQNDLDKFLDKPESNRLGFDYEVRY
jgi:hypothetical protein